MLWPKRAAVRAIDTNIIVRLLANDDVEQVARARHVMVSGETFVALTVLLEAEWVLRSTYGLRSTEIIRELRSFVGVEGVRVEHPERLTRAFDWAEAGMDFADALHLASADDCDAFVSFDRPLAKVAASLSALLVVEP